MLIVFPFEIFICLSAEVPGLILRNALNFSPTTSYRQWVWLKGKLPMEGPSFWTGQPRALNVEYSRLKSLWLGAPEKQGGWPDETVCPCYRRLGSGSVTQNQSMFPGCFWSPIPEKQWSDVASGTLQMHRALCSKILTWIVLCRQCFWPPLLKSPLGPTAR